MSPKILLIDDEALVRDELGGLLQDEGYEVITAGDGAEGLDRFRADKPEMVVTDVRMPHRDGLSLALMIREEAPEVPITVITGHGSYKMAIDALRAGVTDFIRKPVRFDDLMAALTRMEAALHVVREPPALPSTVQLLGQSWTYRLGTDIDAVSDFVDTLLTSNFADVDSKLLADASLGLRELLINAVEHGALGIAYQEKSVALERGELGQLREKRRTIPPYEARRVNVTVERRDSKMIVRIADDGEGFDWRALPDPTDPSYLLGEHGRGVLLARLSFDELDFNEAGNEVTVVKGLAREPSR
jgi:CheY-like chemotaxis protein/anti-sigma regulatory factor (Ser/Thr protein kinase)